MRTAFRAASPALLATVSAVALLSAAPAFAQEAPDDAATVDEIVVTGTRVANRSRLDTLAPVDVVTAQSLQNRGTTEFATALAQSVPSLTFPRPSANDGSDSIRPATLRGLSPDQTLVLVNGTRRHASALVNTNGVVVPSKLRPDISGCFDIPIISNTVGEASAKIPFGTINSLSVSSPAGWDNLLNGVIIQHGTGLVECSVSIFSVARLIISSQLP